MSDRNFPVLSSGTYAVENPVLWIPWELIAPHDAQAQRNHCGQTLERLAQRGGLCPMEAVAVLEDMDYRKRWPDAILDRAAGQKLSREANARLRQLIEAAEERVKG